LKNQSRRDDTWVTRMHTSLPSPEGHIGTHGKTDFCGFPRWKRIFLQKGAGFRKKSQKKSVSIGKSVKSVLPLKPSYETSHFFCKKKNPKIKIISLHSSFLGEKNIRCFQRFKKKLTICYKNICNLIICIIPLRCSIYK
jgi:hypothetical protein